MEETELSGETYQEKIRINRTKEIGKRVRLLREKYTLTQDELARKVLISRSLLSEIENGKRKPSGPILVALESLLMTNRRWILTGIEAPKEENGLSDGADKYGDDVISLLKGFKTLSAEGRKKLMNILRVFIYVEKGILRG